MLRQAPYDKIGQTPTPKYTNANPQSGDPGSIPNAETFNQTQYELENLVAMGGLTADAANLFQSAQGAARGGIWVDALTGTGDLAVATLAIAPSGTVLPALLKGMRVGGVTSAANTSTAPKLRVVNLGASPGLYTDFPILKADGSTPGVGEIKAGRFVEYRADGAGNVLISGGGISTSGTGSAASARVSTTTGSSVVTIAGSTNISSITLGTSNYAGNGTNTLIVSFSTPMPNDRYAVLITPGIDVGGNPPSGSEAHLLGAPTVNGFTIVMMGNSSGIYPDFQTNLSFAVIPNP